MEKLVGFTAKTVVHGGCMLRHCHEKLAMGTVLAAFPQGRMEAFEYDPDRGYCDDEVGFVSDSTGDEYVVYARYGCIRIGGYGDEADALAEALIKHFGLN